MKRIIYFFLLFVVGICLNACYEDESNMDYQFISPITIDVTGLPESYSVLQYGRLKISPMVYKEGVKDDNLLFLWKLKGNDLDKEIGRGMVLDTIIDDAPQTQTYQVLLCVTDETTGIQEFKAWNLTVLNALRDGLVVADTHDGLHSDVSLIMSYHFTAGLRNKDSDQIYRNLYSRTNGNLIPDLAVGMFSSTASWEDNRTLTFLGTHSILRIHPDNFSLEGENNDLFYAPFNDLNDIRPEKILYNQWFQEEVILMKGLLYRRSCQNGEKKYNFQFMTSNGSNYGISEFCITYAAASRPAGFAYDTLNNRFLMMPRNAETLRVFSENTEGAFDPNQVGNMECLFIEEAMNNKVYAVMRDKQEDHYWIYPLMSRIIDDGKSIPLKPIDLNGCLDISLSKFYAVSKVEDVLYYASEDQIYAAVLNTSPMQSEPKYLALPGEKITSMCMWEKGRGYVNIPPMSGEDEPRMLDASYRMLVISTYNELKGTGKVITIPIETLGIGGLTKDRAYHTEFPDFGKILAVAPHER